MNNQAFRPAQTGDVLYPMRVILFIALICVSYQLSRPISNGLLKETSLSATTGNSPADRGLTGLMPWQKNASEEAVTKYAESQERKWRRWNEAMFERSG